MVCFFLYNLTFTRRLKNYNLCKTINLNLFVIDFVLKYFFYYFKLYLQTNKKKNIHTILS